MLEEPGSASGEDHQHHPACSHPTSTPVSVPALDTCRTHTAETGLSTTSIGTLKNNCGHRRQR